MNDNIDGGHRPLILMVDDAPTNIRVLAEALQSEYDVMVATDGRAAIDIARHQERPDIILLDVMMPDVDGYEVCRRLKDDPATRDIPIIFVTARSDAESEEYGFSLGAVDYITKPFTLPIVRARVRAQLNLKGLLDQLEAVNHTLTEKLAELQQQHETLLRYSTELESVRARQRLFAQVFECTNDGVVITDAQGCIIAVNAAFTRISGYSEEEVLGRNPRLLKSGRHEDPFYRDMWQSLLQNGSWSGEVWNRRKNDQIFAELLTISAVRDDQGRTNCYVGVFSDITRIKDVQERMNFLTWHDALTGLPNRLLFSDRLAQAVGSAQRQGRHGAMLVFDVDNFRQLNAARGVQAGDQALHDIAHHLLVQLDEGDTMARMGGDVFAVLLPRLYDSSQTAAAAAGIVAERLQDGLLQLSRGLEEDLFHLRATIGIAIYPENAREVAPEVLSRAETARLRGKAAEGNRVVFFESGMGERIEERLQLERALRAAIPAGQLRFYLQSQVDRDGNITGAEALVRWQHPEHGLLTPDRFIPVAESSSTIIALDRWMLDQACALIARLTTAGRHLHIAVNVSPRHFQCEDFVHNTLAALERHQADPAYLMMEVTEGMMLQDVDQVIERMEALSTRGVRFSIDDFGTGYSSLAYLKRLPISELKVDRSFVQDIGREGGDDVLVRAMLDLAAHFRLEVVAEGVETPQQAAFLAAQAAVHMQGYLFARPQPVDDWLEHLPPPATQPPA